MEMLLLKDGEPGILIHGQECCGATETVSGTILL